MPKRTNDFQELIAYIYKTISPDDCIVEESSLVHDKDSRSLREVDILLTQNIAGHKISIAIECRDRKRSETVEWIDSLIGKAGSLDVNKIVAVSSEGFTQAAIEKAKSRNIDTLSFEEATDIEWGNYYERLGVALTTETIKIYKVFHELEGDFVDVTTYGMQATLTQYGKDVGSLEKYFESYFKEVLGDKVISHLNSKRMELFKTRGDLDKTAYIEAAAWFPHLNVENQSGEVISLRNIKYIILGDRAVTNIEQRERKFGNYMLHTGSTVCEDNVTYSFNLLQDPAKKRLHVTWKRSEPNTI